MPERAILPCEQGCVGRQGGREEGTRPGGAEGRRRVHCGREAMEAASAHRCARVWSVWFARAVPGSLPASPLMHPDRRGEPVRRHGLPAAGDTVIPHSGKVSVRASGRTAEAVVDLPSVSSADTEGKVEGPIDSSWDEKLPPAVWVTVGLLAKDGLALQLRARRAESWRECSFDSSTEKWSVYRPVGGALTVADRF